MRYQFWKSVLITSVIMGLAVYVYVLADMYLYAVAQILNGILVVAGFLGIGIIIFLIVYAEPGRPRDKRPPWEVECQRGRR